jgi:hypothetical protein
MSDHFLGERDCGVVLWCCEWWAVRTCLFRVIINDSHVLVQFTQNVSTNTDGWDTAVLTVRAPDLTNDTFHPHCDQVRVN